MHKDRNLFYEQLQEQSENKCDCYHLEHGVSVCWGTKEKDLCTCGGDKKKCNFYPENRQTPKTAVQEAAALLKQYYDALVEQGFTGAQAFQLVLEAVKGNTYGPK